MNYKNIRTYTGFDIALSQNRLLLCILRQKYKIYLYFLLIYSCWNIPLCQIVISEKIFNDNNINIYEFIYGRKNGRYYLCNRHNKSPPRNFIFSKINI